MFIVAAGASPLPFLGEIVALIVAAAAIAYVCQRLHILPIVGFLVAGVIIGPHALGLVRNQTLVEQVSEIGIILLLFTLGIEFSLERLWRIRRTIFTAGGLQVGLTIAATTGILLAMGVSTRAALFTGALLALSSTAIVLKVLEESSETTSDKGQISVGILIFQDLAVVALVLLVPALAGQGTGAMDVGIALGKAGLIVVAVIVVARSVMPALLDRVARTCAPEIFLLTVVAICLGTAWITSLAGVSLSLGAFLAGLVVSESRFSHHAFGEILPLQMLFTAAFFVSVGMLLDLRFALQNPLVLLGVVAAVVVLKIATTTAGALLARASMRTAFASGLLLAQIGEFSFVLQRTGRTVDLFPAGMAGMGEQMFIAASVLLMVVTPFLGRAARHVERRYEQRENDPAIDAAVVDQPRVELENHVIIAGYGSSARYLARVLRSSGVPFVILTLSPTGANEAEEQGMRVVRGNYSRTHLLELANIEAAKMLVIADDEPEMVRRVSSVARSLNPTLLIVARSRFLAEVDPLLQGGADEVLSEEQEVAVQLFTRVLAEYRVGLDEIDEHVRTVRAAGYAALRLPAGDAPAIRCRELDDECFETRRFPVRDQSRAATMTIAELEDATRLSIAGVQRESGHVDVAPDLRLAAGDRLSVRGSALRFAEAARYFRGGRLEADEDDAQPVEPRVISLTQAQIDAPDCTHTRDVRSEITSTAAGCEECLASGDTWVHLRMCMTCGGVRCCDSSKNQHATKHFRSAGHPIIRSYEPNEEWAWCYPDSATL